jgi:glycosyltransferase involved in cell wall biosynthesis
MVLFLHNRYRTTGGEERAVQDLLWLVRNELAEPAELLQRTSAGLGRARAARALLSGGAEPQAVARAVRDTGARVVHAHNVHPAFGWRALAAARGAGARVVLHLHQYRLVCAIGVCFTRGQDCTRCHGRNTLPGLRLNCRGSRGEALAYGAALALWQRRLVAQADAVVVPSVFARERLRELGAPLSRSRVHVLAPALPRLAGDTGAGGEGPLSSDTAAPGAAHPVRGRGGYALVVSRLAPEKGIDVAIEACRIAGMPLVIAGEGPERAALGERASGADVRFAGHVADAELAGLRAGASVALVPSRSAETFGLTAAEAMAAGVPVVASRVGALPELIDAGGLVEPDDAAALAEAMRRLAADPAAGQRARARVREVCAPQVVARRLAAVYDGARAPAPADKRVGG